jgi:septal ring factor EnvC (AmiA/AmiB activator)
MIALTEQIKVKADKELDKKLKMEAHQSTLRQVEQQIEDLKKDVVPLADKDPIIKTKIDQLNGEIATLKKEEAEATEKKTYEDPKKDKESQKQEEELRKNSDQQ